MALFDELQRTVVQEKSALRERSISRKSGKRLTVRITI